MIPLDRSLTYHILILAGGAGATVMARDYGLEEIVADDLRDISHVSDKAMFGGRAWLLEGRLLCGARDDGLLFRLGKGNDAWALALPCARATLAADWPGTSHSATICAFNSRL